MRVRRDSCRPTSRHSLPLTHDFPLDNLNLKVQNSPSREKDAPFAGEPAFPPSDCRTRLPPPPEPGPAASYFGDAPMPDELEIEKVLTLGDVVGIGKGLGVMSAHDSAPKPRPQSLTISDLRHNHHTIARLMAQNIPNEKIAFQTGHTLNFLTQLGTNSAFIDLVAFYTKSPSEDGDPFERLAQVGMIAADELQHRLVNFPSEFSSRELIEVVGETIVKPKKGSGGASDGVASPIGISISFVNPKDSPSLAFRKPLIEMEGTKNEN